jgi:hypothetical protein
VEITLLMEIILLVEITLLLKTTLLVETILLFRDHSLLLDNFKMPQLLNNHTNQTSFETRVTIDL